MNTPSHAILNLALLGHRSRSQLNGPIFWGALLPDLAMFGFYAWAKLVARLDEATIWRSEYYRPAWQTVFDIGNSIPLALGMIFLALALRRRYPHRSRLATAAVFGGLSVILHCLQDLPLHVDDGHRHFWPFTNFRFESSVSYWDPNHHGAWAALGEATMVLVASLWVWRLLRSPWSRGLLVASNLLMLLFYIQFYR